MHVDTDTDRLNQGYSIKPYTFEQGYFIKSYKLEQSLVTVEKFLLSNFIGLITPANTTFYTIKCGQSRSNGTI